MNEVFSFIGKKANILFPDNVVPPSFHLFYPKWILIAANSSTPLKITSTDEGIRLYTFVSYYNELLQVTWHYKYVPGHSLHRIMLVTVATWPHPKRKQNFWEGWTSQSCCDLTSRDTDKRLPPLWSWVSVRPRIQILDEYFEDQGI